MIEVKIYGFGYNNRINNPTRNRLTVCFDELLCGFVHQERTFQFMGEIISYLDYDLFSDTKYLHYRFPYADGVVKLNNPVRVLDKLTMSLGDPFNLISLDKFDIIDGTSIIYYPFLGGYAVIYGNDLIKYDTGIVKIVGLTSDNPADDEFINIMTRPDGFYFIQGFNYLMVYIGATLTGTLSSFKIYILRDAVSLNLEVTCKKETKIIASQKSIANLSISDHIFYKYQPKRKYITLNTLLAYTYSFNSILWYLRDFTANETGYATVTGGLSNIVAMRVNPILLKADFGPNPDNFDVYYIYIREFGNQCFINKEKNVKYHFVLEKYNTHKSITVSNLSALYYNEGWYRFNKPIRQISSITLDSFKRSVTVNSEITVKPASVLTSTYGIRNIFSGPFRLDLIIANSTAQVGDTIVINGFRNYSLAGVPYNPGDPGYLSPTIVDSINNPLGFKIINIAGSIYTLDTPINIGTIGYSYYILGEGPIAVFISEPTAFHLEFVVV